MKRRTERRTGRWTERPGRVEVVSPYSDGERPSTPVRMTDRIAGPGPYEAQYDIALGYGHDRSIILP
jgi:hypothetical protein